MKSNGFSVVREYVGHGIGTQLHEEPQVPNYVDRKNENPRLKEGMVLAVEPMVNAGQAGSGGFEGQVDGGDEGRLVFGALRALHRGDGERAVGADEAVNGGRGRRRWWKSGRSAIYAVVLEKQQQVLAHLVGAVKRNFVRLVPGDRVEVELSAARSDAGQDYAKVVSGGGSLKRYHESSSVGKEDLRQVQGDPPRRRGAGHLRQPET